MRKMAPSPSRVQAVRAKAMAAALSSARWWISCRHAGSSVGGALIDGGVIAALPRHLDISPVVTRITQCCSCYVLFLSRLAIQSANRENATVDPFGRLFARFRQPVAKRGARAPFAGAQKNSPAVHPDKGPKCCQGTKSAVFSDYSLLRCEKRFRDSRLCIRLQGKFLCRFDTKQWSFTVFMRILVATRIVHAGTVRRG